MRRKREEESCQAFEGRDRACSMSRRLYLGKKKNMMREATIRVATRLQLAAETPSRKRYVIMMIKRMPKIWAHIKRRLETVAGASGNVISTLVSMAIGRIPVMNHPITAQQIRSIVKLSGTQANVNHVIERHDPTTVLQIRYFC